MCSSDLEQQVLSAVNVWKQKTDYMKNNPLCLENFDFSGYEILPIVCFPFSPFVAIGDATREISGANRLRALCSLSELKEWLLK